MHFYSHTCKFFFYLLVCDTYTHLSPGRRLRPLDPAGSCRKEAETSPDPAGKPRKSPEVEAVFRPEICWIFSGGFLSISCAFRQEPAGNHRKKSEKFPVEILLPRSSDFRCFPAGTGP